MELRQILKIIIKNYKIVVCTAILAALLAAVVFWQLPAKYKVSLPLLIIKKGPAAQDQYSGYYALEAADDFGKTVEQWLADAEAVRSILDRAGHGLAKDGSVLLRAQQIDPQQVEVRFSAPSKEVAQAVVSVIPKVLQEKSDEIAVHSLGLVSFLVIGQKAAIVFKKYSILSGALIAFCLGLIFGIFIVFVKRYFKN